MRQSRKTAVVAAAMMLTLSGGVLGDVEKVVEYRHEVMETFKHHVTAIVLIMRREVEYSSHLEEHAKAVAGSMSSIHDIFPAGSGEGETAALATIWEQPEDFSEAVEQAQWAADDFVEAAKTGDAKKIGAGFNALGGSCKGCHDDFRAAN